MLGNGVPAIGEQLTTAGDEDGAATFHEVADGTAKVTILGNTVAMPEAAAAALRSASTVVPFPAGEFLPGADSRRALPTARQFLRLGALKIAS